MKKSDSQDHKPNDSSITQMQIDQSWLQDTMITPKSLFQCPICFYITLQPVQCKNCQKLFCKMDYLNCKLANNSCPLCKTSPWEIKNTLHTAYRDILQNMRYKCVICDKENMQKSASNSLKKSQIKKQNFSQQQFRSHLKQSHMAVLKEDRIKLYKYFLENPDPNINVRIQLTKHQNIQIYFKTVYKKKKQNKVNMIHPELGTIRLNVEDMKYLCKKAPGGGSLSKSLFRQQTSGQADPNNQDPNELIIGEQNLAWFFQQNGSEIFFSQEQMEIIQKGYQQYLISPPLSEIHLDLKETGIRYRIMYDEMKQVNLKTKFERKITRLMIKIGDHNVL